MTAVGLSATRVTSPAPREMWHHLIDSSDDALPDQVPAWTDALCDVGPYVDASRHYEFADGSRTVLPLVRRRGLTGVGGWASSYPAAWGIGGPIGQGISVHNAREIIRDLRTLGHQRVSIRPNPLDGQAWREAALAENVLTIPRRAHVLDLSGGLDAVWAGVSKTTRRHVRNARRAGVRVEVAEGGGLVEEYFELFLISVDRWADQSHEPRALARARARRRDPVEKMRALGRHLGPAFRVILLYVDDMPAAGGIVLCGRTAHTTRGALDKDRAGNTHAGALERWTEIEQAHAAGCVTHHLGESGRSETLAFSKEKWGAKPYDYVELRIERLPWTRADTALRSGVKRVIGFTGD